jgi:hypothetical protein
MRPTAVCIAVLVAAALAYAGGGGRVISAHGVRLTVPAGWQRVAPAGDGSITDPRTLLVVGTRSVTARPSRCQIAAYRLPPTGAVVVVVGWKELVNSGAQGSRPGRWPLHALVTVHRPSFECFSGRGAVASLVLRGRAYQVNVMVGDRASKRRVADALAVARSIDVVR